MNELKATKKYLWLHDIAYPETFNEKIIKNVDKIMFLSKWHRDNLPDLPEDKVFITNNGINPEDFVKKVEKRPNSLIWSSSYDRGLLPFIKNILPLIKKEIPDVTLDVAYGWQNILKEMEINKDLKELYTELSPILENTPGITHHGRLSHKKLHELMLSSMVYPYASEFGETNNITSQKMQAAGVFVVTTSQSGGTPERVKWGHVVDGEGIYTDQKLQKEFAKQVVAYLRQLDLRSVGATDIRVDVPIESFSWSTTAKQWQKEIL
jgi:glycosyltransferase involved in cell wall biosynthesis